MHQQNGNKERMKVRRSQIVPGLIVLIIATFGIRFALHEFGSREKQMLFAKGYHAGAVYRESPEFQNRFPAPGSEASRWRVEDEGVITDQERAQKTFQDGFQLGTGDPTALVCLPIAAILLALLIIGIRRQSNALKHTRTQ